MYNTDMLFKLHRHYIKFKGKTVFELTKINNILLLQKNDHLTIKIYGIRIKKKKLFFFLNIFKVLQLNTKN